jgi:hypothetical protein
MRKTLTGLATAALMAAAPAWASLDTYTAFLYGSNEVGGGDADGFGVATLIIDNAALQVSWSIAAMNIDFPLTGAHIHAAPAGVNGSVIVSFNSMLTGEAMFDADLASITPTNADDFYVNLHTAAYPGGAIRGQLEYVGTASPPTPPVPEPATTAMMLAGLGLVGWIGARRRNG